MTRGFIYDSDFKPHNISEIVTEGIIVTESDHTAIHKGYGYKGRMEISSLSSGGTQSWSFTTPSDKYIHFKNMRLNALGASSKVEFLENVTITEDIGNQLSLKQLNLNSDNISGCVVKESPTYSGGESVDSVDVLIDTTNQTVGSGQSSGGLYEEIVLEPDTTYVIKLSNTSSDDTLLKSVIKFFFYEEPEGLFFK